MYYQIFELHANLLKALSHPKRLEIIHLLRDQELNVSEMLDMLGLPQANLSQHLMSLRDAQVVKTTKKGKHVYYRLAHKNFSKVSDLMRTILVERYQDSPLADEFTLKMSDLVPLVRDPICGMRLSPRTAAYAVSQGQQKHYFCAQGCYEKFNRTKNKKNLSLKYG